MSKINTKQFALKQCSDKQISSTAPILNEDDARIIKGMLRRGDKQQDVAIFFGVNQEELLRSSRAKRFKASKVFHLTNCRHKVLIHSFETLWDLKELKKLTNIVPPPEDHLIKNICDNEI